MAKRQDSGSNSAHENQQPTSHNEDALPEMTDDGRNRADEADDDDSTRVTTTSKIPTKSRRRRR